jgi:hypothetical protein
MSPSFGDVGDQNDRLPSSSKSRLYNELRVPHVSLLWRRGRPERPFGPVLKKQALLPTPGAPCLPLLETWETRTTACPALQKASCRLTSKTRAGTARSVAPGGRTAKAAASNRGVTKSVSTHQSPGGHNLTPYLSRKSKKMRLKKYFPTPTVGLPTKTSHSARPDQLNPYRCIKYGTSQPKYIFIYYIAKNVEENIPTSPTSNHLA